jgi:metal-responsive CopG/Arc/MetJ family transcriptional regulator
MKAVQVTLDERLLAALDADDEVQRDGRSAVLRRAAAEYLRRKHHASVAQAYRRGYGRGVGRELEGWADEGTWPDDD